MENTLRDAIDTIRNLAADVNPERDSPQSPSSPPISNSTQIHFFEYREPDHQTKTRIGAYLPERDGIQLRINPQAGKEIEGGMVWYPTKGFIPADADPTKFPDLSWTERENAATPKPEELHIRDDATGYIQVDASWATK